MKQLTKREKLDQSHRLQMSWRRILIKQIGGLMELSSRNVLKALRTGDPTISIIIFKLLYQRSHAWRKRLAFSQDPTTGRQELERAFAEGQLSTDEYGVLLRGRELQLKILELEATKDRLAAMEDKLAQLMGQQGEHNGQTQLPARWNREDPQLAGP